MANFIALVYATLKNEGIDTKGMSQDEAVKKFNELQESSGGKKGKDGGTPAENRRLKKTITKHGSKWEENAKGEIESVTTKNGRTIKIGDKLYEYKITGFDPSTNSVEVDGSDYSVQDIEKEYERIEYKKQEEGQNQVKTTSYLKTSKEERDQHALAGVEKPSKVFRKFGNAWAEKDNGDILYVKTIFNAIKNRAE